MRGIALLIIACLGAGAVINVAVAWGCALRLPLARTTSGTIMVGGPQTDMEDEWWVTVGRLEAFGAVQHETGIVLRRVGEAERDATVSRYRYDGLHGPGHAEEVPVINARWSRLGPQTLAGRRVTVEGEAAAGWPLLALWGAIMESDPVTAGVTGHPLSYSLELKSTVPGATGCYGPVDELPFRLIWPGFAANTIFYGSMCSLILLAPGAIRRRRRRRRGLCPACGYPAGDSALCTECGVLLIRSESRA